MSHMGYKRDGLNEGKHPGVICDRKVPTKLRQVYRTAILYGSECWTLKEQHDRSVGVAEMRMLRWMCDYTRKDRIRNDIIREKIGVAPIKEKMTENRLRWFGHIQRKPQVAPVRRADN